MADDTDWNTLKERCATNKAKLVLRGETFDGQYRFALTATDRLDKVIYDIRANDEGHAPQHIITTMVNQALGDWWNG